MGVFLRGVREMLRAVQVVRYRDKQFRRAREERRFEERQERHRAGIYEPPHPGGL